MQTYLFYDLETSGLNNVFDQVLQFAAIRTDIYLSEIERHEIKVRVRPDVICTPRAIITNRISVRPGPDHICEFEAISKIHALLNTPGTISLGYNSLGFDDEFLRFGFYRNLLPPYTHQYASQCRRMDLLPMAVIFRNYKSNVINWPLIDGKPTLKLEHLSTANQLAQGPAHDAMVDVQATLGLARRFFAAGQDMRDYLDGCFNKNIDTARLRKLPVFTAQIPGLRLGIIINNQFGSDLNYQALGLYLGDSIPYPNQSLWLRLDWEDLRKYEPQDVYAIRKKYGEAPIILPPLERYLAKLNPRSFKIAQDNQTWLTQNQSFLHQVIKSQREFKYEFIPDLDVDAALYQNGFFSSQEEKLCLQFREKPILEKIKFLKHFNNPNLLKLGRRILWRNYPKNLTPELKNDFLSYLHTDLHDHRKRKRFTPADALVEIQTIKTEENPDQEQIKLMDDLKQCFINKETIND